jgi:hypothetical protein
MSQYKQMTTTALGRILVAIGTAILEEQSPRSAPVESVFRLKRPRGLDVHALNLKRLRREPPSAPPSVDSELPAESHVEVPSQATDMPSQAAVPVDVEVTSQATGVPSQAAVPVDVEVPSQAAEVTSQDAAPSGAHAASRAKAKRAKRKVPVRCTAIDWHEIIESCAIAEASQDTAPVLAEVPSQAAEVPSQGTASVESHAASRSKAKRAQRQVPVGDTAFDWHEILEPCAIAEATTAAKVLEVARQKYGVAVARMHFSRDKQTSLPGPDGKAHRVFKYGLPRGLAWKLK